MARHLFTQWTKVLSYKFYKDGCLKVTGYLIKWSRQLALLGSDFFKLLTHSYNVPIVWTLEQQ